MNNDRSYTIYSSTLQFNIYQVLYVLIMTVIKSNKDTRFNYIVCSVVLSTLASFVFDCDLRQLSTYSKVGRHHFVAMRVG